MPLILLDTNVLVYACNTGEPVKRDQAGAGAALLGANRQWSSKCTGIV